MTQRTSCQGGLASSIGAGNVGCVTAEANVTGRCWGRGCCWHTAWGHGGLIPTIKQISPVSAQTCCSFWFPAVRSSLTQPAHHKTTQLSGVLATSQMSTVGTRDGQQAGPSCPTCQAGPSLGSSRPQVSPGFSRANSSQEETRQQILGETVAAVSRRDGEGGALSRPRGAVAGWRGMLWSPGCRSVPGRRLRGPFSCRGRSRGSAGLDAARLLPGRNPSAFAGFFPPAPSKSRSYNPEPGSKQAAGGCIPGDAAPPDPPSSPPPADTAVPTLTPRGRVRAVPTAPRHARLTPHL